MLQLQYEIVWSRPRDSLHLNIPSSRTEDNSILPDVVAAVPLDDTQSSLQSHPFARRPRYHILHHPSDEALSSNEIDKAQAIILASASEDVIQCGNHFANTSLA